MSLKLLIFVYETGITIDFGDRALHTVGISICCFQSSYSYKFTMEMLFLSFVVFFHSWVQSIIEMPVLVTLKMFALHSSCYLSCS